MRSVTVSELEHNNAPSTGTHLRFDRYIFVHEAQRQFNLRRPGGLTHTQIPNGDCSEKAERVRRRDLFQWKRISNGTQLS